ncbi:hypothetical protein ACE0DR_26050 [Azotobacter sp. CWF10]
MKPSRRWPELGQHISGDEAKLRVLRRRWRPPLRSWKNCRKKTRSSRKACGAGEERLASWQQRWEQHTSQSSEASRAGDVERTRVDCTTGRSSTPTGVARPRAAERAGLDVDALEEAFEQLHLQHDRQKAALDELSEDVELRKQAWRRCRNSSAMARTELAELRKQANGLRGRTGAAGNPAAGRAGRAGGSRGLAEGARPGFGGARRRTPGRGCRLGNACGKCARPADRGVLVDDPASLVGALGEPGEGPLRWSPTMLLN